VEYGSEMIKTSRYLLLVSVLSTLVFTSCAGFGTSVKLKAEEPSVVSTPVITPSGVPKILLRKPTPIQFWANVPVTWSLSYGLGNITCCGSYNPPATHNSWNTVFVIATSVADPTVSSRVAVSFGPYETPVVVVEPPVVVPTGGEPRPTWNHGIGFFVKDGKLFDANGIEFIVRGVNKLHWDSVSEGLKNSGANTVRWDVNMTRPAEGNVAMLLGAADKAGTVGSKVVVMPGNWEGTCSSNTDVLTKIVDKWVDQAETWKKLEKYMILNIANEWGPADNVVWRDSYIAAVKRIRAAGWMGTISITAGACGQDSPDILKYGQAVLESDSEKNIIFDLHVYGFLYDSADAKVAPRWGQKDISTVFADLKASGLVVVIGEFGPGNNVGPSPTMIPPKRVVELAEKNGIGWLVWAWDDNNLMGGLSDDKWFSMSYKGKYDTSADLTLFGKETVEDPVVGLKVLAKPASIYTVGVK